MDEAWEREQMFIFKRRDTATDYKVKNLEFQIVARPDIPDRDSWVGVNYFLGGLCGFYRWIKKG